MDGWLEEWVEGQVMARGLADDREMHAWQTLLWGQHRMAW